MLMNDEFIMGESIKKIFKNLRIHYNL